MSSRVDQNTSGPEGDLGVSYTSSSTKGTFDPSLAPGILYRLHTLNELVAAQLQQDENQTKYQATEHDDASCCQKAEACFRNLFSKKPKTHNE